MPYADPADRAAARRRYEERGTRPDRAPARQRYEERNAEQRKGDRHRDPSRNGSNTRTGRTPVERAAARHQKVVDTPWWGIDGEGINRSERINRVDSAQDYVYMSATRYGPGDDGVPQVLEVRELRESADRRLSTHECLWFLWMLPRGRNAFYSSGYDWDKILCDLPRETIEQIYDSDRDPFEPVWWQGWGIINLRNAVTIVRKSADGKREHHKFFADLWRCLGTGSFINACKAWKIGTPEDIAEMEEWKPQRGAFTEAMYAERGDEIRHYCQRETANIAELAYTAAVAASEIDLRPPQWYSAGSIGKALARRHGVLEHRGDDRWAGAGPELREWLAIAFGGGRFESCATGPITETWEYDLASSYPANMTQIPLPCLAHGRWERGDRSPWRLEHVSWEPTSGAPYPLWGPLPFRAPDGSITYPINGRSVAWSVEGDAARKIPGYTWQTHDQWSWVPECEHRPFDFIPEVYAQRLALGKDGAGLILKVGTNALYGTTADTLTPNSRYASAVWSGLITAGTRARLAEVIAEHGDKVVLTATDSVVCTEPIMGDSADKVLGGWDYKGHHEGVLLVQPGLYYAERGLDRAKTRGHNYKDFVAQVPQLSEEWGRRQFAGQVTYDRTRFVTARLALHRRDWSTRGQWITSPVTINYRPTSRLAGNVHDPAEHLEGGAVRTWPLPNLVGARWPGVELSSPYSRLASLDTYNELLAEKLMAEGQPNDG